MKTKGGMFLAVGLLLAAALACQNSTSEFTPEAVSTTQPVATSLPSLPVGTDIPTALPTATLAPPLGLFPGKVAFTDMTGHLALIDMLTGEITPLTEGDGIAALGSFPIWSGDGSRFTYGFLNTEINKGGLAILDVTSGEWRVVSDDFLLQIRDLNYALSPDGSFLIYDTWEDIGEFNGDDVWRLDVNSGERTLLTANQDHENSDHSTLSPDGTRIAYHLDYDIWVMNADGSNRRNLTPDEEYYWMEFSPAWSPDSARVAFFRSYSPCGDLCTLPDPSENTRGWPPGLWVVNTDSGEVELLVELPRNEMLAPEGIWLSWSPDGRYLAYLLYDGLESDSSQIRIVEVATGNYREVISTQSDFYFPTWSPDSKALMLNTNGPDGDSWRFTVYVAAVDGSGVWTLFDGTRDQSGEWTLFTAIGGYHAAWSP